MPLWSRRNLSVDEVLATIKHNAEELRREARQVSDSHAKIDKIADRLEALHARLLQERSPDA